MGFFDSLFSNEKQIGGRNAREWRDWGYQLYELGRYDDAIKAYDRAIELKPNDAHAWEFKGMSLAGIYRHDDALEAYDRAIELDPICELAWERKGESLEKLGRSDDAIRAYDRATELNPKFHLAWCNKGESLEKFGRYDDAIRAYDRAIELYPSYKRAIKKRDDLLKVVPYTRILQQISSQKKSPVSDSKTASVSHFKKPIFQKKTAIDWVNKGNKLFTHGHYNLAIKAFDRAIKLDPSNKEAIENRNAILKMGD